MNTHGFWCHWHLGITPSFQGRAVCGESQSRDRLQVTTGAGDSLPWTMWLAGGLQCCSTHLPFSTTSLRPKPPPSHALPISSAVPQPPVSQCYTHAPALGGPPGMAGGSSFTLLSLRGPCGGLRNSGLQGHTGVGDVQSRKVICPGNQAGQPGDTPVLWSPFVTSRGGKRK